MAFSTLHCNPQTKFFDKRIWCTFSHKVTKMAPNLLKKLFDKVSPRADYEKFLPPTRSSISSATLVRKGSDTDTDEKPSNFEKKSHQRHDIKTSCVQICPHKPLSFELMKRIVHIP